MQAAVCALGPLFSARRLKAQFRTADVLITFFVSDDGKMGASDAPPPPPPPPLSGVTKGVD